MQTKTKSFIWNLWRIYTVQLQEELHNTPQCFLFEELLKNEALFKPQVAVNVFIVKTIQKQRGGH